MKADTFKNPQYLKELFSRTARKQRVQAEAALAAANASIEGLQSDLAEQSTILNVLDDRVIALEGP